MYGSYKELQKVRAKIEKFQLDDYVHHLTCGNDSRHQDLTTRMELLNEKTNEFQLLLVCKDCNYTQEVPLYFIYS